MINPVRLPESRQAATVTGVAPGPYAPAALADLMAQRLRAINAQIEDSARQVSVNGQLVELPQAYRNGVIYDAHLVDPLAPADYVLLEVRSSVLERAGVKEGDIITAYGSIVGNFFKGRLTLRLRTDRVTPAEAPEARERRSAELPLLETVRRVGGVRRTFPACWSPTVAMLRSGGSAVREDFLSALGPLRQELQVRDIMVSMTSPQDLAAAIQGVHEDVVVLIRGGGSDADFGVFETPQVIQALGTCQAYRLIGLGHSGNRTLADCVADWAANVPAEAGRFLAERVREVRHHQALAQLAEAPPREIDSRLAHRRLAVLLGFAAILLYLILLNLR